MLSNVSNACDQNLHVHICRSKHDQHTLVSEQDNRLLPSMFLHYHNPPYSIEAISVYQFVINYAYSAKHSSKKALPLLNDDGFITNRTDKHLITMPSQTHI